MKIVARSKRNQNRALVDPWTVVHFGAGLALGLVAASRKTAWAVAVGYEVVEQLAERHRLGQEIFNSSRPESLSNAVVDVAVFLVGHDLGERWNRT